MANFIDTFEEIDFAALETVAGGRHRHCAPPPCAPPPCGGAQVLTEQTGSFSAAVYSLDGTAVPSLDYLIGRLGDFAGSAKVTTSHYSFDFSGRTSA